MNGFAELTLDRHGAGDWVAHNWVTSAATALVAHALLAIVVLPRADHAVADAGAPVVMVEFAPQSTVPVERPNDLPPGPQQLAPQQEEQAAREEKRPEVVADTAAIPATRQPERPEITLPQETTVPKTEAVPEAHARLAVEATPAPTAAPSTAFVAERAASPAPGQASEQSAKALAAWQLRLVAHLERFKRYPREALAAEGEVNVAFTLDRSGKVIESRIVKSSGSSVLDAAALDLVRRAQPLPAPPAETVDAQLSQVAPLRYVAAARNR